MRSAFAQGKRGVLFDIDGTIADSVVAIVLGLGDAYERFLGRRPVESEVRRLIGMPLSEQMNLYGLRETAPEALNERVNFAMERFEAHHESVRLFEPAIQTMRLMQAAGLRVALVTSKNSSEIELYLKDFPPLREADVVVTASDVARPKPYPDSAFAACERLGVAPAEAFLVGDSPYDLLCGRSAGMPVVAVAYGAAERSALSAEAPEVLVDTPDDLLAWARTEFQTTSCPQERNP